MYILLERVSLKIMIIIQHMDYLIYYVFCIYFALLK